MRLVSYNVLAQAYVRPQYYLECPPAALEPRERRKRLLSRIRQLNADILCLQEAEPDLIEELGMPGRFFKKAKNKPDGCAILTARSGLWTEHHYQDGSGHGLLMLQLPELTVATTHLKWAPPGDSNGLAQIREALSQLRTPGLICGDFNCERSDPVVLECLEAGLQDAFEQVTPNHTFVKAGQPRRIDFVLHSSDLKLTARPMPETSGWLPDLIEPSDHLPLIVELQQ